LIDRGNRFLDNPDRRPSHADKRRAKTKEMLGKQFLSRLPKTADMKEFRKLIAAVISLSELYYRPLTKFTAFFT